MTPGSKEYLIKAYTYLNSIYLTLDDPREMYGTWDMLRIHMNLSDGAEARRILATWLSANRI